MQTRSYDDSRCELLKSHWARFEEPNEATLWLCRRRKIARSRSLALSFSLSCACPLCTHSNALRTLPREFGGDESSKAVRLPCAFSDSSLLFSFAFRFINAISAWMERWFLFYLSLTGLGSVLIARPLESASAAAAADKSIERKQNFTYLFLFFLSPHTHTHTNCVQWLFIFNWSLYIKCVYMYKICAVLLP